MTSVPAKLAASAALAAALVLGGASGAIGQENGSNGSGEHDTTTTTAFSDPDSGFESDSGALPVTGGEAALALGGAGALIGLAYAARRAAQAKL